MRSTLTVAAVVLMIAAGLGCLVRFVLGEGRSRALTGQAASSAALREASGDPAGLGAPASFLAGSPAELDESTDPEGIQEGMAVREEVPSAAARLGTLKIQWADARSEEPLDRVGLRLLSECRYAEQETGAELDAWLTPGRYQGRATRLGYDALEIPSFEVRAGETTDLGTLVLEPGSAAIHGWVQGGHLPADALFEVELHGPGRRPCPRCAWLPVEVEEPIDVAESLGKLEDGQDREAPEIVLADHGETAAWEREEPCPACGYAAACSRRVVRCGERFAFWDLAAGRYTVRLRSGEAQPIGQETVVDLEPGAARWVAFEVIPLASVTFLLLDPHRQPYQGIREQDGEEVGEAISFSFFRDGKQVGSARFSPQVAANFRYLRGVVRAQGLFVAQGLTSVRIGDLGLDLGVRLDPEIQPVDREREPSDSLITEYAAPELEPGALPCEREGEGFRIDRLPCQPLEVEVQSGPYASARLPFQPRPWSTRPVVIPLELREQKDITLFSGGEPGVWTINLEGTLRIESGLFELAGQGAELEIAAIELSTSDQGRRP